MSNSVRHADENAKQTSYRSYSHKGTHGTARYQQGVDENGGKIKKKKRKGLLNNLDPP